MLFENCNLITQIIKHRHKITNHEEINNLFINYNLITQGSVSTKDDLSETNKILFIQNCNHRRKVTKLKHKLSIY